MALALTPASRRRKRSARLDTRERAVARREREFQRLREPITFQGSAFVGMGDSQNAANYFGGVTGSAAASIGVIRDRIQGLPLGVYARRFTGGEFQDQPIFNHPLQKLLDDPTRDPATGFLTHSASQLWGMVVSQLLTVGECYLLILSNGLGIPYGLQVAKPGKLEPMVGGGRITGYRLIGEGGASRPLRPTEVVRIWQPNDLDLFSPSGVVGKHVDEIDLDLFALQTHKRHYQNDGTPKLIFENVDGSAQFPSAEKQDELGESWARRFQNRVGRMLGVGVYLKPGWTAKELHAQSEAAAGVSIMTYSSSSVMEGFRVPPSKVGRNVDVNRAAAETANYTFDVNTIEPITLMIAEALTNQLAPGYPQTSEDVRLVVKFRPFIARDKDFELRRDQADVANYTRSVDEVREAREPALPTSGWGALPLGPFGIGPITGEIEDEIDLSAFGISEPADPETPPAEPVPGTEEEERRRSTGPTFNHLRAWFQPEREWRRILQRESRWTPKFLQMQRALFKRQTEIVIERYLERERSRADDPEDLAAELFPIKGWGDLFRTTVAAVRVAAFFDSGSEAVDAITGLKFSMDATARAEIARQDFAHYVFTNRTTQSTLSGILRGALEDGLSVDETARRIAKELGEKNATRAKGIAHTEMAAATQAAQVQGYKQTGVVEEKRWNTSLDSKVRDSHTIEGQTRGLDEDFRLDDNDTGAGPGSPDFQVRNRANCRCFVTPVFIDEDALSLEPRPEANLAPGEIPNPLLGL